MSSSYLFGVTLDGTGIAMRAVGLDPTSPAYDQDVMGCWGEWTGDVSAFAGEVVDLRITDLIATPNPPLLELDQIEFLPVPEPSTAALFGVSLLAGLLAGRRGNLRTSSRQAHRPA